MIIVSLKYVTNKFLYLKERRMEKKANKQAFSAEKVRQTKEQMNLQTNLQGLKLS